MDQGKATRRRFYVLAVDPGASTGVALMQFDGFPRLVESWRLGSDTIPCDGIHARGVYDHVESYVGISDIARRVVLVTERQFQARGNHRRAQNLDTMATASHAGGWRYMAQARGMKVYCHNGQYGVLPNSWRQGLYGKHKIRKTVEYKLAARKMVEIECGLILDKADHDRAEAICIGIWACRHIAVHGLR